MKRRSLKERLTGKSKEEENKKEEEKKEDPLRKKILSRRSVNKKEDGKDTKEDPKTDTKDNSSTNKSKNSSSTSKPEDQKTSPAQKPEDKDKKIKILLETKKRLEAEIESEKKKEFLGLDFSMLSIVSSGLSILIIVAGLYLGYQYLKATNTRLVYGTVRLDKNGNITINDELYLVNQEDFWYGKHTEKVNKIRDILIKNKNSNKKMYFVVTGISSNIGKHDVEPFSWLKYNVLDVYDEK